MKIKHRSGEAETVSAGERVLVRSDVPLGRFVCGFTMLCVVAWTAALVVSDRFGDHPVARGRFGWSLALLAAVALIARGVFLGRPVTSRHAMAAAASVCLGLGAHFLSFGALGNILLGGSGLALMWPTTARPQPELLQQVWTLVEATHGDPLAPFAMHSSKSYCFNVDKTAAIAYRTRLGFAVVSGDPVGDDTQFQALVDDFTHMCRSRGWRILVLACGERHLKLWRTKVGGRLKLEVPIGRDVVVDVRHFSLKGRRFRNLRQGVQRTHNCGITTEIVDEQEICGRLIGELTEVLYAAHHAAGTERGFCMSLDAALQGRFPGVKLAIARDGGGRVVAFHRYATAGHGTDVTLDVPYRRPDAPNGVDERLTIDMIAAAKSQNASRLSLAFAAFPEIFQAAHPGPMQRVAYRLIHLLDPFIRLESLYRYLRKYHALGGRRYVVLPARQIPAALLVLLSLEFTPRPHHPQRPVRTAAVHA
ncbi:MAG: phosphatidylglycerol lysyltransferase domain-containing protein [Actinomycetota bacterium]|uniref:Phosphatidylglycerol lysyltransferase domain-containing protein n=1 Tax=Mycobacterium lentiflavum TaxID=141349 RepID=A0ABY3UPP8_MYCLN|nr:phosphatidylglycerol lysyltransferase domain-containing protein [Mycobacterium lentiflavum]MEE3066810.1 phosphatidylglycerol lysyltransferase domain-containing protein [Actinomycetota bacterium]ULP40382.1 phosphatidylglycerol lysyltransferase domain-containing protein [Mycobacterium lentiflavum]